MQASAFKWIICIPSYMESQIKEVLTSETVYYMQIPPNMVNLDKEIVNTRPHQMQHQHILKHASP